MQKVKQNIVAIVIEMGKQAVTYRSHLGGLERNQADHRTWASRLSLMIR